MLKSLTAIVIALIGLLSPWLAAKIEWLWIKLAWILGYVNGKILLTLVFFLVLTPVAWLSKISGNKNFMLNRRTDSYFTTRDHKYVKEDLEEMW